MSPANWWQRPKHGTIRPREQPADEGRCGWVELLPEAPPARRLGGRAQADCAVVGAGFTGLAAARRLAELRPQWRVVVLEARRVGHGASGRNSGFIVDVGHFHPARGLDAARRLARLGRHGCEQLRDLVRAHGIECGWTETGRLHAAAGDRARRLLDHFLGGLDDLGEPYERLGASALTAITGSAHYIEGARTPGGAMLQPAALVRGLAMALPANVELYEESPLRSLRRTGAWEIETPNGTVSAGRVLVATNGYTPALGLLRARLFPLHTFASLTRPLTAAEQSALGGDPVWGLTSEEALGTTVRRTPDQRILIRNTVHYSGTTAAAPAIVAQARERHAAAFRSRFPMLDGVPFDHTWGGVMGASLNGASFFGEIEPGLLAAAGYNGVGVALGTTLGILLADRIAGATSPLLEDALALPTPSRIPPEPILGVSVRATLAYLRRRAGQHE